MDIECVLDSCVNIRRELTPPCKDLMCNVIYQRCVCDTSGWLTSQVELPIMGKCSGIVTESLSRLNEF